MTLGTARPSLQEAGIGTLPKFITDNGRVTSTTPGITLEGSADKGIISEDSSTDLKFCVVDDSHKLAALERVDDRNATDDIINVQVYGAHGKGAERLVATSERGWPFKPPFLVLPTLHDSVHYFVDYTRGNCARVFSMALGARHHVSIILT